MGGLEREIIWIRREPGRHGEKRSVHDMSLGMHPPASLRARERSSRAWQTYDLRAAIV